MKSIKNVPFGISKDMRWILCKNIFTMNPANVSWFHGNLEHGKKEKIKSKFSWSGKGDHFTYSSFMGWYTNCRWKFFISVMQITTETTAEVVIVIQMPINIIMMYILDSLSLWLSARTNKLNESSFLSDLLKKKKN